MNKDKLIEMMRMIIKNKCIEIENLTKRAEELSVHKLFCSVELKEGK